MFGPICDKKNTIVAIFRGVTPQDIYEAIFKYEKDADFVSKLQKDDSHP